MHPHLPTDQVGDLVRAITSEPGATLTIDGRRVRHHDVLSATGMRWGSTVSIVDATATPTGVEEPSDDRGESAALEYAIVVGPACDRWRRLAPGRHVVGRSPDAGVHVDDPTVEVHHGRLAVAPDGTATFVQLTGRTPVRHDDEEDGHDASGGRRFDVGASVLAVRPVPDRDASEQWSTGSIVGCDDDPWRAIVRRGPVDGPPGDPVSLVVPQPPPAHRAPPAIGLVGAAVAAAGAGLMAAVLGQALFALFAMIGAVGSVVTWIVGAAMAARARRRAEADHGASREEFTAAIAAHRVAVERRHLTEHRSIVDALRVVHEDRGRVWSRRPAGEPLRVTVGRGDVGWAVPLTDADRASLPPDLLAEVAAAETLHEVPAPLTLRRASAIALHGDVALGSALARSIVVQLAASHGPADLRLVVLTQRPQDWAWVDWLPHAGRSIDVTMPGHVDDLRALVDADATCATVVVTDVPALLVARTGAARRMLATTGATCLVVAPSEQTVPAVCDRVLEIGSTGHVRWRDGGEVSGDGFVSVTARLAGITVDTATDAVRGLAPLIDPETEERMSGLPRCVGLGDVGTPSDAARILAQWHSNGADPPLAVTLGVTGDGTVEVDLVRDGPHALIAGTTGAGKSEVLRTLVVGLAARVGPDHVTFVLVDFKGGATFDACGRLPHVVGVVTDLDPGLAERALVSLEAEIARRERLLRDVRADDLAGYRRATAAALPRLVVVIDEFASLAREHPEFLAGLVGLAQRGRSLGIHLILATQRPAGVVNDDIRANTNLRLALRVQDAGDAVDVVGDDTPTAFPRSIPGRAALRLGSDEIIVFQAASCTGSPRPIMPRLRVEPYRSMAAAGRGGTRADDGGPTELSVTVEAIGAAVLAGGYAAAHRPWLEPLPATLPPTAGAEVGIIDDPARQRRRPLRWDGSTGNLLLVGSLGSGTTTASIALAADLVRRFDPSDHHLYVIDGRGDGAWAPLADLDHCGAVIGINETERMTRLLQLLTDDIAARTTRSFSRRSNGGPASPRITLMIDGFGPVRAALAADGTGESTSLLDRVLAEGPAVGISACVATDGTSPNALTVPAAHRWVFHVTDPTIARAAGLTGRIPPADVAGRMRIVESGLDAQVACGPAWPDPAGPAGAHGRAPGIDVLPELVEPTAFDRRVDLSDHSPGSTATSDGGASLALGIGARDLAPSYLRVTRGDHVFIGGSAGTGKSTALRQLTFAWQATHPDGVVVSLAAEGVEETSLVTARHAAGRPLLVAVDDADRVDDMSGVLAALATRRDPEVTIIAAARLEAVRVAYGHWVRDVARSRCGLIMTSAGELDGELLGAVLPRRSMIPPRPGLAWMIDTRGPRLVQVAARMPS